MQQVVDPASHARVAPGAGRQLAVLCKALTGCGHGSGGWRGRLNRGCRWQRPGGAGVGIGTNAWSQVAQGAATWDQLNGHRMVPRRCRCKGSSPGECKAMAAALPRLSGGGPPSMRPFLAPHQGQQAGGWARSPAPPPSPSPLRCSRHSVDSSRHSMSVARREEAAAEAASSCTGCQPMPGTGRPALCWQLGTRKPTSHHRLGTTVKLRLTTASAARSWPPRARCPACAGAQEAPITAWHSLAERHLGTGCLARQHRQAGLGCSPCRQALPHHCAGRNGPNAPLGPSHLGRRLEVRQLGAACLEGGLEWASRAGEGSRGSGVLRRQGRPLRVPAPTADHRL